MFEVIRNNKRVAQLILGILIVPFAFFGLEAYFKGGAGGGEVAKVDGVPIYQIEFDRELREQQNRLRQMGRQMDQAMLASDEFRFAVLDNMVNGRVLSRYAEDMGITVSAAQIYQVIAQVPEFQENGQFSPARYKALLANQNRTPAMYEASVAQDMRNQQIMLSVGEATLVATASARLVLDAQSEGRVVREWRFPLEGKLAGIGIADEAIQKYYDDHPTQFERPERIKAEYVVFNEALLQEQIEVGEDEIRKSYEEDEKRYTVAEERQARHILISVAEDADEATVTEARRQVDDIATQLRKSPAGFAELARKFSQDPGSKERGGDLGFFKREDMVKPFADAAFTQKKGEIGEPVRSKFGFHIVQVTEIRAETLRPLSAVRDEVVAELRKQAAGQRYAELAEKFSEKVHVDLDSLEPVAQELGLKIQKTDWIDRGAVGLGVYRSAELINELFSNDVLEGGYNTQAIPIGVNALIAARVTEHEAAQRLPLAEVKGAIEEQLKREQAQRAVKEEGEAAFAALGKGETVEAKWGTARTLRRGAPTLSPAAERAVFAAKLESLPAWAGVELPGAGYVIYQIDSVERTEINEDDPRLAMISNQYGRLLATRDFSTFLTTLRARYKVETRLPSRNAE
ncbi:MAG: SurA N-terminal domain-containing protein [Azoarcus sp.]|nr:SurA N-terminal domain-containing protein [Azoarcus sp.]